MQWWRSVLGSFAKTKRVTARKAVTRVEASIEARKAAHVDSNLPMMNNYRPREKETEKRKTYFAMAAMETSEPLLECLAVLLTSVAGFIMFYFVRFIWFFCLLFSHNFYIAGSYTKAVFADLRCAVKSLIRKKRCGSKSCRRSGNLDTISLKPLHRCWARTRKHVFFLLQLFFFSESGLFVKESVLEKVQHLCLKMKNPQKGRLVALLPHCCPPPHLLALPLCPVSKLKIGWKWDQQWLRKEGKVSQRISKTAAAASRFVFRTTKTTLFSPPSIRGLLRLS